MSSSNPFFQEVVDTCVDIEQWLSGRAEPARLSALLARFSPRFSMISLQGTQLERAQVDAFFSQGHGARAGLSIAIDQFAQVQSWPGGSAIVYRETQLYAEERCSVRRSTALFERDAHGRIVWLHLHETPVVD